MFCYKIKLILKKTVRICIVNFMGTLKLTQE